MIYPIQLLPNKNYKIIECDISDSPLVRFIELKEGVELIDPDTGKIQLKYIADPTKHISDYSTNLLGVFEIEHLPITLTQQGKILYNDYCLPNIDIDPPIFPDHFEVKKGKKYFTIRVSDLSNLLIPYEIEGKTLTGKCVIEHTPMKWNFWHFSIRWLNADAIYLHVQDEKLFKRGGWVRQLSSAARAMLVQFADLKEPNYYIIPKACYLVDNHFA